MFLFSLLIRLIWPYCDDKQIFYKKDKKSRECILMSLILLTLKHTFWTCFEILWINQTQNATKLGFITMKIRLDNKNIKSHFDTTHEWWSHEAGKDNSFTPFISGYSSRKQKIVLKMWFLIHEWIFFLLYFPLLLPIMHINLNEIYTYVSQENSIKEYLFIIFIFKS